MHGSGCVFDIFPLGCQSPAALRPHIIKMLFTAPAGQTFVVTRLHRAVRKYCSMGIPIGNEQCETQRSACALLCSLQNAKMDMNYVNVSAARWPAG